MKTLYVNGCSWTAGNGIEFDPAVQHLSEEDRWAEQKKLNWAVHLSRLMGRSYINQSRGAGSNKRMVRKTCEYLQSIPDYQYKNTFVILGWTSVDRSEIFLQENRKEKWCVMNATQSISSHDPPFSKNFLREIDNYQREYITTAYNFKANYFAFFQEMYLMSNLLENLGIPYLFFSSLPWRRSWTHPSDVDIEKDFSLQLAKLKKPQILNTRNCNDAENVMSEYCTAHSIPMAPDHHTMIEGHRKWAEHLFNEIRKIDYANL